MIRNCTISHRAQTTWPFGNGIYFTGADNLSITDVAVELVRKTPFLEPFYIKRSIYQDRLGTNIGNSSPKDCFVQVGIESGPTPDLHNYNINGLQSTGVRISNVSTPGNLYIEYLSVYTGWSPHSERSPFSVETARFERNHPSLSNICISRGRCASKGAAQG